MQFATHIEIDAPMPERVLLWKQDYPHLVSDPLEMVRKLTLIRPLVGGQEFEAWESLAHAGDVDSLFERVMTAHYDPCYARTAKREHKTEPLRLNLHKLSPEQLSTAAKEAIALSRLGDSTSPKANEPAPH
jgi:tRNA 2-selenouridine synthase